MGRRPTAAEKVLRCFVSSRGDERYGLELIDETGLRSGSLYPALMLLEDRGWVTSRWEVIPDDAGRPRRRLYRMSEEGARAAASLSATSGQWFVRSVPPAWSVVE